MSVERYEVCDVSCDRLECEFKVQFGALNDVELHDVLLDVGWVSVNHKTLQKDPEGCMYYCPDCSPPEPIQPDRGGGE